MAATISDTPHAQYAEDEDENEVNFMLTPDMRPEVKREPTNDIVNGSDFLLMNGEFGLPQRKPTITLTPTMKLLASPNPMDPKRRFTCPYDNCTKSYGKSSHLRSHLTWHTGIKPYVCQEYNCGKSFTRSDELNRHSRTHTGEKPFECMQCAKKFSRSDHLTKHVATHTKQTQSQKRVHTSVGAETTEVQSESPAPKKALPELTEMSLPKEGMSYNDGMHFMASLLESAQFKHGRNVIKPENLTEEADHLPIRIKLERPEHSAEYKVVNAAALDEENETKHEIASATAMQSVLLKQEIEEVHDAIDIKSELDPTCTGEPMPVTALVRDEAEEEDFSEEDSEVADNENTNDNSIMPEANAPPLPQAGAPLAVPRFDKFEGEVLPERPYRCLECGKCFKRQDDLTRHHRTHTGEKPYACTNCDRRFNRSDHMKKHLKTHSKER